MGQPAVKNEPAPVEQELYYTDMSVGEILRRTRVHYGQSLQDIERALRIRACQLEALETGNVENLPGRVYAIGFVRSYAEYLGLDGGKMVHLFKTQAGTKAHDPSLDFPVAASESKIPPAWLAGVSVVLAVILIAGWVGAQNRDRTLVTEIPSVPASLKVDDVASSDIDGEMFGPTLDAEITTAMEAAAQDVSGIETAAGTTAGVDTSAVETQSPQTQEVSTSATAPAAATPAPVQKGILLNIMENSWVEIKDGSGNALVSRVLRAGDQYYVPDRPDLNMSLGNAGGVQIKVDGQLLRFLGERGQVRRNISLDAKNLKAQYSVANTAKTIENLPE